MGGTAPSTSFTVQTAYIINFIDGFFVALYDSTSVPTKSAIFRYLTVGTTPTYSGVDETNAGTDTLTVFTDNTANFMQIQYTGLVASGAKFFYVDNYDSATQKYYKYTTTDTAFWDYLDIPAGTSIEVSFSFASSTLYTYILRTSASSSAIIKYSLTSTPNAIPGTGTPIDPYIFDYTLTKSH